MVHPRWGNSLHCSLFSATRGMNVILKYRWRITCVPALTKNFINCKINIPTEAVMEVFAFTTDDVEFKLYDILSSFRIIDFALTGLHAMKLIKEDDLCAFNAVLRSAIGKTESLVDGMKPILLGQDKRIVLLYGEVVEDTGHEPAP